MGTRHLSTSIPGRFDKVKAPAGAACDWQDSLESVFVGTGFTNAHIQILMQAKYPWKITRRKSCGNGFAKTGEVYFLSLALS